MTPTSMASGSQVSRVRLRTKNSRRIEGETKILLEKSLQPKKSKSSSVPKYPNCIRNQHGFFLRFEKKKQNVEIIDFILAYQLGLPGVQSEMLPHTLIDGLFSSQDFPRKKRCEDPGDLRNKLGFSFGNDVPGLALPGFCSFEKIVHHFHSLALGGSFGR